MADFNGAHVDRSRRTFIASASAFAGLSMLAACSKDMPVGNNEAPANQPAGNDAPSPTPEKVTYEPSSRPGVLIGPGVREKDGQRGWS